MAGRRVPRGRDQVEDLLGRPDVGELDPGGAGLEQPVDLAGVAGRDPDHGGQAQGAGPADQRERGPLIELGVLAVHDGEVEPGRRHDVHDLVRRQLHERAHETLGGEPFPEVRRV